jgi:hypothetical protein
MHSVASLQPVDACQTFYISANGGTHIEAYRLAER